MFDSIQGIDFRERSPGLNSYSVTFYLRTLGSFALLLSVNMLWCVERLWYWEKKVYILFFPFINVLLQDP